MERRIASEASVNGNKVYGEPARFGTTGTVLAKALYLRPSNHWSVYCVLDTIHLWKKMNRFPSTFKDQCAFAILRGFVLVGKHYLTGM